MATKPPDEAPKELPDAQNEIHEQVQKKLPVAGEQLDVFSDTVVEKMPIQAAEIGKRLRQKRKDEAAEQAVPSKPKRPAGPKK